MVGAARRMTRRYQATDGGGYRVTRLDADLPPTPLERVVIVAGMARTGSSLLSSQLASTGCVGMPREYLNPIITASTSVEWGLPRESLRGHVGHIRRRLRGDDNWRKPVRFTDRSFGEYLRLLADRRTTPNGVFSMKTFWDQWEKGFVNTGQKLDVWNAPITWVRLTRTDIVAQAISYSRALQTGQWSSNAESKGRPVYNEARIANLIEYFEHQNTSWDRYFQAIGVEPYVVHYESLAESTTETVSGLLGWLGFPDARPAPPSSRRQSGTESAEWQQRFLKSHHAQ